MAMRELAIMASISACVVGSGVIRQTWPRRFRASRILLISHVEEPHLPGWNEFREHVVGGQGQRHLVGVSDEDLVLAVARFVFFDNQIDGLLQLDVPLLGAEGRLAALLPLGVEQIADRPRVGSSGSYPAE